MKRGGRGERRGKDRWREGGRERERGEEGGRDKGVGGERKGGNKACLMDFKLSQQVHVCTCNIFVVCDDVVFYRAFPACLEQYTM